MSRVGARVHGLPPEAPCPPLEIRGLDRAEARELQEICRETDPRLYAESLLGFGIRLEQNNKPEAAAEVYATIVGAVRDRPLRHRARLHLDALQGRGAVGPRAETLLRQFSRQATDPRTIVPMMLGSAVFGLTRNLALGRLLASREASWLTRGWGARIGAGVLGFGLEVPTFVATARAMGGAHGPLGKDLFAASLTLGALKSFGLAGHEAARAAAVHAPLRSFAKVLPEVSMFSGLMAAHKLEEQWELRPRLDNATFFTDTLAAYFSLGVGGRLGRAAFGRRFAHFQNEMTWRAEQSGEPMLRRLRVQAPPAKAPLGSMLLPAPAPLMIFMTGAPFERLFRWLEKRLYRSEERLEYQPSIQSQQRMEGTMRILLRRFPKLRKVLARSPWTLEQRWELLKAVTPDAKREPWEVFHYLPKTLIAMEEAAWPFERQLELLQLLSRAGEYPIPIHKYIPAAMAALRESHWGGDMKFSLLYSLAEKFGPNADRIYANLPGALKAMRESRWSFEQQSALLENLANYADQKIGTLLSHLPAALAFMFHHEWTYAQQSRLLILIADRARDDLQVSWMMEDHLPTILGMMTEFDWTTAMQSGLLTRMLDRAEGQSSVAMEFLPGLLDVLKKHEWRSEYVYETLVEIFDKGGVETGKMIEVMPILLQTMRNKGLAKPTQRELLGELAVHAAELSKLAFVQFALSLVNKPLNRKPS